VLLVNSVEPRFGVACGGRAQSTRAEARGKGLCVCGVRFMLARDVRSVREARLRVRAIDDFREPVVTDAELVVSEFVTNSLLHVGLGNQDVIEVALQRDDGRFRRPDRVRTDSLDRHDPDRRALDQADRVKPGLLVVWG
jgi:anti-sigma regulatory factor (Ser/Thr protein kinase)